MVIMPQIHGKEYRKEKCSKQVQIRSNQTPINNRIDEHSVYIPTIQYYTALEMNYKLTKTHGLILKA